MASYRFFISNNEQLPSRVNPRDEKYTVSTRSFLTTKIDPRTLIFQMVSDLYFSMVSPKDGRVEYEIVAFKAENSKYYRDIDYFSPHCKKLIKFSGLIENNIFNEYGKIMVLNSVISYKDLEDILITFLPPELVEIIHKMTNNVKLELMVNDYQGNYYISNPSFTIKSSFLKSLL